MSYPELVSYFILWATERGLNYAADIIRPVLERYLRHLYQYRHAMATQMLENGADLRWIQAMLGHRSVESTQIYTQVSIRTLQAVHASTHPAEQKEEEQEIIK